MCVYFFCVFFVFGYYTVSLIAFLYLFLSLLPLTLYPSLYLFFSLSLCTTFFLPLLHSFLFPSILPPSLLLPPFPLHGKRISKVSIMKNYFVFLHFLIFLGLIFLLLFPSYNNDYFFLDFSLLFIHDLFFSYFYCCFFII